MTVLDLIEDLRAGLAAASKKFKFPAQYTEALQNVKVFSHCLPMSDVLDTKLYPLILLELQGVSHSAQSAVATILFTIGTYKENGGGVVDNLILAQEVQNFLLVNKLIGGAAMNPAFDFFTVESSSDEFFFSQLLCEYRITKLRNDYLD